MSHSTKKNSSFYLYKTMQVKGEEKEVERMK